MNQQFDTVEHSVQRNCVDNITLNSLEFGELNKSTYMHLISIFTFFYIMCDVSQFLMSMVMYRSNNVVCHNIWFCIRPNLGPFLVTFRSLLTSSEFSKFPKNLFIY